ncbi:MAG: DUF29 domain-containing protein [Bryobacteraceae bacterium]
MPVLYDQDFYEWTQKTVALVRAAEFDRLDAEHLAEEIEDMGNRDKNELESRLAVLISHLLKWDCQPDERSPSWAATIRVQRTDVLRRLGSMPGLKRYMAERWSEIYEGAVDCAVAESQLEESAFPAEYPYTMEQVLAMGRIEPERDRLPKVFGRVECETVFMSIAMHPEVEARLRTRADAEGLTIEACVERIVRDDEQAEQELASLALEGLNSGESKEADEKYWEEKRRRLIECHQKTGAR